jgi:transcriptional regulator with XRE-family HTH domain
MNKTEQPLHYLREWRLYRGLSQPELAERVDTSHQVIGYLERGRTQLSANWLQKLAPALQTQAGHIIDYNPEELDADVLAVWSKIPSTDRPQALRVLRTFAKS